MESLGPIIVGVIFTLGVCAVFGACMGAQKQAALFGFVLGLLFGPLGVIAAGLVDERLNCPRCGGRINWSPTKQYPICQHCGADVDAQQLLNSMAEQPLTHSLLSDE